MTIIVRMCHVRDRGDFGANLCTRGAKAWFDSQGLDFRAFLDEGLPVETLEALQDALADRVCAAARRAHAAGQE